MTVSVYNVGVHILVVVSDNCWSAFCVFHAHFWGKTHSFKICALKKRNDFRQLKRSNFRVKKGKTEENLFKFLNNMAYKTVSSMRDCIMKRNFMLNINSFYFDKMHMLYNKRKSCVKSCKKHCFFKKTIVFFFKNPLFFNMCTFLSHCFETKNYHCM